MGRAYTKAFIVYLKSLFISCPSLPGCSMLFGKPSKGKAAEKLARIPIARIGDGGGGKME